MMLVSARNRPVAIWTEVLTVSCPTCGAVVGAPCQSRSYTKWHKPAAITRPHRERIEALRQLQPQPAKRRGNTRRRYEANPFDPKR